MRYQSIIRFFEYAHIEYAIPESFNLVRAKKLVNAEFAMQADGIIIVDQFSYTKQDILAELEHPDFMERLDQHKRVWENPSLLDLLEKDKVNLSQHPAWFHLGYAPHFKEFVSEYFAAVFDRVMRALLSKHNLYNATIWLDYLQFVAPDQEEEALRSVRLYIDDAVRFFRNLNDESYKTRDEELSMWYKTNWSAFVNKLPDSMLGYVDELISAIINFTVRIQKSNREICLNISKEMLLVTNTNYSLKQLIRSNHESYKQNYQKRTVKGYFSNVNYIYIAIVVLFWVARLFMNNSSSDGDDMVRNFKPMPISSYQQKNALSTDSAIVDPSDVDFYSHRAAYFKTYDSLHSAGFDIMSHDKLGKLPFDATQVYIFIQGHNDKHLNLDTVGFENLTNKVVIVDIVWSGKVYHHHLNPNAYVGFRLAADKNFDLLLSYKSMSDTTTTVKTTGAVEREQYIHINDGGERSGVSIEEEFGTPDEMPYLLHSELKGLPVYVKINQEGDKVFYDIQTKGGILSAHSSLK